MNTKRSILQTAFFLAALAASSIFAGPTRAQTISPQFVGKFTLTSTVHWGKGTLPPGNYTLRIASMRWPIMATISNDRDTLVASMMSRATEDYTSGPDALQLESKNGQTVVQSLVLADLNMVLIFEPSTKHKRVEEAQAAPSVPVLVARK